MEDRKVTLKFNSDILLDTGATLFSTSLSSSNAQSSYKIYLCLIISYFFCYKSRGEKKKLNAHVLEGSQLAYMMN